jgi:hypothetical protein
MEPDQGFGLHAETLAARERAVALGVDGDRVDELVEALRAATARKTVRVGHHTAVPRPRPAQARIGDRGADRSGESSPFGTLILAGSESPEPSEIDLPLHRARHRTRPTQQLSAFRDPVAGSG